MKLALRISVLLLAAGCATSNMHRSDQTARRPRSPESVRLYFEDPKLPYEVISFIEVSANPSENQDDLQKKLINKAARIGGDGVIVRSEDEYTTMTKTGNGHQYGPRRRLAGDVIVFRRSG